MAASVFISFRRNSGYEHARSVYTYLVDSGWRVWLDGADFPASAVPTPNLAAIAAHDNFVLVLTPGALDGCHNPQDDLRREIEYALSQQKRVVVLLFDGFRLDDVGVNLTGGLAGLTSCAGIYINRDFFAESMARVRQVCRVPTPETHEEAGPQIPALLPDGPELEPGASYLMTMLPAPHDLPPGYTVERGRVDTDEYFMPVTVSPAAAAATWEANGGGDIHQVERLLLMYQPVLLAQASVAFRDPLTRLYLVRVYSFHVSMPGGAVDWRDHAAAPVSVSHMLMPPRLPSYFGKVPAALHDPERRAALRRDLSDFLQRAAVLHVPYSDRLRLNALPDCDSAVFAGQMQVAARVLRDRALEAVASDYNDWLDDLNRQMRDLMTDYTTIQAEVEGGPRFFWRFMGRDAREQLELRDELSQALAEVSREYQRVQVERAARIAALQREWLDAAHARRSYPISAHKKDISLDLFGVGWLPHWFVRINGAMQLLLPACTTAPPTPLAP